MDRPAKLDLSPCEELSEIKVQLINPRFRKIIPILRTIASPRFRKLWFLVYSSDRGDPKWALLDKEVPALAERVNATAAADRLEVVFSNYPAGVGGMGLSEIEGVLPRIVSNARVSLRVEEFPPPLCY